MKISARALTTLRVVQLTKKKKKIDILKHDFVPEHKILSQEQVTKLLERYNMSKFQLPFINLKDPVIKEIKAKAGDVVKISRKGICGENEYYRRVVE